ncbi:hypothetical protein DFQ00_12032 [Paenibacillus barcinonensis]|nr:hypothetical protein DFQ00_12032 [Paenibacillus barcinonensis]
MQIQVVPQKSSGEAQIIAKLDESIIRDGSWVMFEIINPAIKGPIWLQADYEGEGIYTTKTTLPSKSYTLLGHFYAAGGFHFSRQYEPQTNSNLN